MLEVMEDEAKLEELEVHTPRGFPIRGSAPENPLAADGIKTEPLQKHRGGELAPQQQRRRRGTTTPEGCCCYVAN